MRLQRFAFAGDVPVLGAPRVRRSARRRRPAWLGEPSREIVDAMEDKRRFLETGAAHWPDRGRWEEVRSRLAGALELFGAIEPALEAAGIPAEPGYLDVDARTLRATFRYASRLRARYTVIDFLEGQGVLDDALDASVGAPTSGRARAGG